MEFTLSVVGFGRLAYTLRAHQPGNSNRGTILRLQEQRIEFIHGSPYIVGAALSAKQVQGMGRVRWFYFRRFGRWDKIRMLTPRRWSREQGLARVRIALRRRSPVGEVQRPQLFQRDIFVTRIQLD